MTIPFWKVQSVGNHFPLFLAQDLGGMDLSDLAQRTCARGFGIGGDGLLVLDGASLRMFNPDGSEDFCGNGLRCAAWFRHLHQGAGTSFSLRHGGRDIAVTIDGTSMSTVLGEADYSPAAVPHLFGSALIDRPLAELGEGLPEGTFSVLSTGSAHLIARVSFPPEDFEEASLRLEHHPLFPERVSVMWTTATDEGLSLRIWERGVGETWGCGSGATAAAADHLRREGAGGEVAVRMRGGTLLVSASAPGAPLTVAGEAAIVYAGDWIE